MEKVEMLPVNAEEPRYQVQELTLPKEISWDGLLMCDFQGFWLPTTSLKAIINFQRHFEAKDSDILLATMPKSGTTWLKALVYSIVNRNHFPIDQSPLLTTNPHSLVPLFKFEQYKEQEFLQDKSSPRILSFHTHYQVFSQSVFESRCRIIYLCRNPLDQFISYWHFRKENPFEVVHAQPLVMDEAFDLFCKGIHVCGPFWDHALGYWNASLDNPEKVLFLKYEDLKVDTFSYAKKIAEFLGFPFSKEEEEEGLIEDITRLCSFENLKNLEVNKKGSTQMNLSRIKNYSYFRKGKVGDWANYLTPSMAERLDNIMKEKLDESGLTFGIYSKRAR